MKHLLLAIICIALMWFETLAYPEILNTPYMIFLMVTLGTAALIFLGLALYSVLTKRPRKPVTKPKQRVAVCCECGSEDVEIKGWVHQQTGEIIYADMIEDDDVWCNVCENHVNVDWVVK